MDKSGDDDESTGKTEKRSQWRLLFPWNVNQDWS